jgi:hypothetical protein
VASVALKTPLFIGVFENGFKDSHSPPKTLPDPADRYTLSEPHLVKTPAAELNPANGCVRGMERGLQFYRK